MTRTIIGRIVVVVVLLAVVTMTEAAFCPLLPAQPASITQCTAASSASRYQQHHDHVLSLTTNPPSTSTSCTTAPNEQHGNHGCDRRQLLMQSTWLGLSTAAAAAALPLPAQAAKESSSSSIPSSDVDNVQAAFDALRFELNDRNGGIATMQTFVDDEDFAALRDFTKTYDLILRKQKWARCKSYLQGNAEKEVATLRGNAVTFDLIGINRASRVGKESKDQANKYLKELREDLQQMVDMQGKIPKDVDGFEAYMKGIRGE